MMNILSHCVTDRRSMTAAIKHCQKHNIPTLIVRVEAFQRWWFDGVGQDQTYAWETAPFKQWVHSHNNLQGSYTEKFERRWLKLGIWPASMNPEGF